MISTTIMTLNIKQVITKIKNWIMAKYATLKAAIEAVITTNGNYEISGEDMRETLKAIVDSLGANYQLVGFALPATDPGTPDQNVAYLAGPGTYPNFGPTTVDKGQIGLFKYNGAWSYETIDCGVSIEYEEYPGGDAFEWTFYDSENPDGLTIKIAKTVSGLGNDPNVAISQWWAAQTERKINVLGGYTISIDSLTTTPQSLGLFKAIQSGQIINSITGANKLIFGTDGGGSVTVNASELPYKATANLVNVRTESGTANNVSIVVRGINDILPAYININEIANHPGAYASAAAALSDVPALYRRKGVKVVYYDDDTQLWIEMLCCDDAGGANWWTDIENNWAIEGPIETKIATATGGQQLRIAGEKRGNLDDVLNVNVWNEQIYAYDSAASARTAVPANKRKLGATITYLLDDGWHTEHFIGTTINHWDNQTLWQDYEIMTNYPLHAKGLSFLRNPKLNMAASDYEVGGLSYGQKTENDTRLRCKFCIPIHPNDTINYEVGNLQVDFFLLEKTYSQSYIWTSSWLSTDGSITFQNYGFLYILCKKSDDSSIQTTDYDCTISINNNTIGKIPTFEKMGNVIQNPLSLNSCKTQVLKIIQNDIEQGYFSYGTTYNNAKRLKIKNLIPVQKGDVIKITTTDLNAYCALIANLDSESYITTSGWIASNTEYTLVVEDSAYLLINFKATDESDIVVSDYDCNVIIINGVINELSEKINSLYNHNDIFQILNIGGFVAGGINPNAKDRVRTDYIPITDKIYMFGYDYTKFRAAGFFYTVSGNTYTYHSLVQQFATDYFKSGWIFSIPSALAGRTDVVVGLCLIKRDGTNITNAELSELQNSVVIGYDVPKIKSGKNRLCYQFGGDGNNWCFVRTPDGYDANRKKPYPFVICNHGNGWVMNGEPQYMNWTKRTMYVPLDDPDYISNPTQYNGTDDSLLWYSNPTIEALLAAGYIVCGCENYGDNLYGNENCRKACAAFFEHMVSFYNVEKRCCMIGASNGAQTSINAAYLLGEKVKAMILQYPLTCLVNQYFSHSDHQAPIRAAYGISDTSIDEAGLISATRTHDVLHTNMANNIRVDYFPPTKLYYSPSDTVVNYLQNAIAMFDMLDSSLKIVDKKECSGGHGDYSHFAPAEYVEFFNIY